MGGKGCAFFILNFLLFLSPPKKETAGAIVGEGDWRISADCHFHLVCHPQLPPLIAQIQHRVSRSPLLLNVPNPNLPAIGSFAQTRCCYYLKLLKIIVCNCELCFFFYAVHDCWVQAFFFLYCCELWGCILIVHWLFHSCHCFPPEWISIPLRLSQLIKLDIYWGT